MSGLYSPPFHGVLSDITPDQHHPRGHDHSLASDGASLFVGQGFNLPTAISPPPLGGNVNNYNPTSKDVAFLWRIDSGGAARDITGIAAPNPANAVGPHVLVCLAGSSLTLLHNSGLSSAPNGIICHNNTNVVMGGSDSVWLIYDVTSAKWRIIGSAL